MCVISLCTRAALDAWSRGRSTAALAVPEEFMQRAIGILAMFLCGCRMSSDEPASHSRRPVIDMHVHAYVDDPRFGGTWTNPLTGSTMVASADADAHQRATVEMFNRFYVVKAVTSGGDHEGVLRWKKADPDRIVVGYAFDDPVPLDIARLRTEHAAGRLEVLGEIGAQYEGISPQDSRLEPLFAIAEELDIPVAYHVHPGPPGAPYMGLMKMRAALGSPLLLENVLVSHPKLRLYVMHAGWPMLDEMVALMYTHPQVYADLGAIAWSLPRAEFHGYLRHLVEAGFGKRIMFGSDQMVWPQAIEMSIEAIEEAAFLTEEQKRDIFCGNAARFLRLHSCEDG
jgi:predicted TIM-barrel fold metal-dependent hydrolase